jgi:hypothetical protein
VGPGTAREARDQTPNAAEAGTRPRIGRDQIAQTHGLSSNTSIEQPPRFHHEIADLRDRWCRADGGGGHVGRVEVRRTLPPAGHECRTIAAAARCPAHQARVPPPPGTNAPPPGASAARTRAGLAGTISRARGVSVAARTAPLVHSRSRSGSSPAGEHPRVSIVAAGSGWPAGTAVPGTGCAQAARKASPCPGSVTPDVPSPPARSARTACPTRIAPCVVPATIPGISRGHSRRGWSACPVPTAGPVRHSPLVRLGQDCVAHEARVRDDRGGCRRLVFGLIWST